MTCFWLFINRVEKSSFTWFDDLGLKNATPWEIYLDAFVFVSTDMMGCSYLNSFPKSKAEEIANLIIIPSGLCIYAIFFAYYVYITHEMNKDII